MIDWSRCADAESVPGRCSAAWVVKDSRVMVEGILDNFDGDQTPLQIARMFTLPVATVRRVLHFALSAEIGAMLQRRYTLPPDRPRWRHRDAKRLDKLTRQLAEIEKALRRSR
jgi:uncharacterized protein (DUF433 family)